jgi:hypothetical protein
MTKAPNAMPGSLRLFMVASPAAAQAAMTGLLLHGTGAMLNVFFMPDSPAG